MKFRFSKLIAAGLVMAMAICIAPANTVKAADPVEFDIEAMLRAVEVAIGNQYNADFETPWSNDGEDAEFVGYAVDKALKSGNDGSGYVTATEAMADLMEGKGLGYTVPVDKNSIYEPGDIIANDDRVIISLGQCGDGSVLFATTDKDGGVYLAGTVKKNDKISEASSLAMGYMGRHFPEWFEAHRAQALYRVSEADYLKGTLLNWNHLFVEDERDVRTLQPWEVLQFFENNRVARYGGVPYNYNPGVPSDADGVTPSDATADNADSAQVYVPSETKSPATADTFGYMAILPMMLLGAAVLLRRRDAR